VPQAFKWVKIFYIPKQIDIYAKLFVGHYSKLPTITNLQSKLMSRDSFFEITIFSRINAYKRGTSIGVRGFDEKKWVVSGLIPNGSYYKLDSKSAKQFDMYNL